MVFNNIKSTNPDIDYTSMGFNPRSVHEFCTWIRSKPPHINEEKWLIAVSKLCMDLNTAAQVYSVQGVMNNRISVLLLSFKFEQGLVERVRE